MILSLVSKKVLQRGIPQEYDVAGMCARSCLETMCDKLQSGEVNIEDLQKVSKNREQMQRLCLAISSNKEDARYSYTSVETVVKKRLEEYTAVKRRKEVLSHLRRHIHSEQVQGISCPHTDFPPSNHEDISGLPGYNNSSKFKSK